MSSIDKGGQLGEFDTITREQYRRTNGTDAPPPVTCLECAKPLTEVQIKRGGQFCTQRCSGNYNARQPAKPKRAAVVPIPPGVALQITPTPQDDVGFVHIAAALAQVLLAIPGARIEIHVGPIALEVRQ